MRQEEILRLFPEEMRKRFAECMNLKDLEEIRIGINQPVQIKCSEGKMKYISREGRISKEPVKDSTIGDRELENLIQHIFRFSPYAFEQEISQGFITVEGGHRIGLAGQVVLNDRESVKNLKYIRFLNIRIAHEIKGCANLVMEYIKDENQEFQNTLIVSPPGCGKTTLLRDMVRSLSNGFHLSREYLVGVVDERSEIGGNYMGIPQNDLGLHTMVMDACPKVLGMQMLARSMAPDIIAVDEIGTKKDLETIFQMRNTGIRILASVHGNGIEDIRERFGAEEGILSNIFNQTIVLEKVQGIRHMAVYKGEEKVWQE